MGRPDRLPDKAFNVTFSLSGGVYAVTNTGGHAYDGLIVCPKIGNRSVLVMCKAKLDSDIADQEFQAVGYAYGLVEPNRPIAPAAFDGRISRSGWRQFRLVAPVLGAHLPNGGHVDLRFMVPYAGGANYSVKDIVVCDVETGFTLSDLEKYGFSEAAHFWDRFPAPDCRQLTQRYVVGSVAAERAAIGSEIALAKAQAVLESAGAPYRRMAASPEARTFASPGWYLGTGVSGIESGKKYLFTLRVVGEAYNDFSTLAEIRGGAWYYTSRVRVVKAVDAATQTGVLAGVFTGDALGAINIYGQANNQAHTGQSALAFGFYEITDAGFESAANIALLASRMLAGKGISDYLFKAQWEETTTHWKGKKALCLGDSLTAAGVWQQQLTAMLGMTVATRALGGIGLVGMVDGAAGLAALTSADVTGQDLIVLFGGYNNRSSPKGAVTDMYPAQNTYAGMVNYAIQRIFALLAEAGNAGCQVLIVTPHCPGKYGYIDADGYAEYPPGSGQSLMDLCDIMAEAANRNNLRCLNLWRVSGINRWNWAIYAASPTPTNADGSGSGPYPHNNDQLHLNAAAGYPHLGAVIARYVATF